jgi:hypothetical protein
MKKKLIKDRLDYLTNQLNIRTAESFKNSENIETLECKLEQLSDWVADVEKRLDVAKCDNKNKRFIVGEVTEINNMFSFNPEFKTELDKKKIELADLILKAPYECISHSKSIKIKDPYWDIEEKINEIEELEKK